MYKDDKGNIINVGDKIKWKVTVFKSKYDKKITVDTPLIMENELTLEKTRIQDIATQYVFKDKNNSGWLWGNLRDIDAEAFNVSVIKI